MQAIITKHLPPTNYRGSRIKASCERGSLTMHWPDCETQEACHIHAAQALVEKFIAEDAEKYGTHVNPWAIPRVCGSIPSGEYVHVFALNDTKEALVNLVKLCDAHRWKANADERDAITEAKGVLC